MDEPDGRARYLDLALSGQVGAEVLAGGLPALPGSLTYEMTFPVAYWAAAGCGVVLFLHFRQWGDHVSPIAVAGTFLRDMAGRTGGRWSRTSARGWCVPNGRRHSWSPRWMRTAPFWAASHRAELQRPGGSKRDGNSGTGSPHARCRCIQSGLHRRRAGQGPLRIMRSACHSER